MFKEVYPNAKIFMIEGSETCSADLNTTGNWFAISLVGKENSVTEFFETKRGTGNSIYRERSKYYSTARPVLKPIRTLDSLMAGHPPVQMLKLDIQGAELDALKGARRVLRTVEVVMLEVSLIQYNLGAPAALDTLAYLHEQGFDLFDLHDFNNLGTGEGRYLGQVDLVLVRKESLLFTRRMERMRST